jgi:hypothetical protein
MLSARKTMSVLLVCLCICASGFAQQTTEVKPKVFGNLPSSITISESLLQSFFSLSPSQEITLDFGSSFTFPCKVLSKQAKFNNLQTVIVKSPSFGNAIFQVSRITNDDNSISYVGRIMNEKAFDGFAIKKSSDGTYKLEKFETGNILDECKL